MQNIDVVQNVIKSVSLNLESKLNKQKHLLEIASDKIIQDIIELPSFMDYERSVRVVDTYDFQKFITTHGQKLIYEDKIMYIYSRVNHDTKQAEYIVVSKSLINDFSLLEYMSSVILLTLEDMLPYCEPLM